MKKINCIIFEAYIRGNGFGCFIFDNVLKTLIEKNIFYMRENKKGIKSQLSID
jgi:hypothetical protein